MLIPRIIKYIDMQYGIICCNRTFFNDVYITDLAINAPSNSFGISRLYSCGVSQSKKKSLLKALIEIVERIVFIEKYVGPIDFIESKPYIADINHELYDMSLIVPSLGNSTVFHSKGYACHCVESEAKKLAKFEFYERKILDKMEFYFKSAENIDKYEESNIKFFFPKNHYMDQVKFISICIDKFYFSAAYHRDAPGYILGSAVKKTEKKALVKAYLEAISKVQLAENKKIDFIELAEGFFIPEIFGKYISNKKIKAPAIIRRHNSILSKLELFLYQAVKAND